MKETGESHHCGPFVQTSREILPSVIEPRSHRSEWHQIRIMEIFLKIVILALTEHEPQRSDPLPLTYWQPWEFLICWHKHSKQKTSLSYSCRDQRIILVVAEKGAPIRVFEVSGQNNLSVSNYPTVSPPQASVGLFLDMYRLQWGLIGCYQL